jgi:hypothetical protein
MKRKSFYLILLLTSIICCGHGQTITFMSGIERDLSSQSQAQIIQGALPKAKITTFKHTEVGKLITHSRKNPNSIIILFSAAAKHTYRVVTETNSEIWIVEPHYSSAKTIKDAIKIGFPKSQIILGPTSIRGANISTGCRRTPNGLNHFQALKFVTTLL